MDSQKHAAPPSLFRALADETRLRILNLLTPGELCVGDLVETLGLPQPTASRHLAYLRKTKLVTVRKDGLWCFYALAKPSGALHKKLLDCVRESRAAMPQLRKDDQDRRALLRKGGCCPKPRAS